MSDVKDFAIALQSRGLSVATVVSYTGWISRFAIWLRENAGEDLDADSQVDAQGVHYPIGHRKKA